MDDNYIDNQDEEWARYNWFPPEDEEDPVEPPSEDPWGPQGPAPDGTQWMLNPNTGGWEAIPIGTVPPWGLISSDPNQHYPQDNTQTNPQPPGPYNPQTSSFAMPQMDWPSFSFSQFDPGPAFSYKDFAAPNQQDMLNDPGFQFRIDQGRKALEASAAGKGILRSGGTLKDLLNYGQNFASQEYGNVYNRALSEYDTNRRNALDTWNTGYMGRKDKYGFDFDAAKYSHDSRLRNMEFDRNDLFNRWSREGDWLTQVYGYGAE